MTVKGIQIEPEDQVVTLVKPASSGDLVVYEQRGKQLSVEAAEHIPQYHKIACENIAKGQLIFKYGQPIGTATVDIKKGQWVHTHNLISSCLA